MIMVNTFQLSNEGSQIVEQLRGMFSANDVRLLDEKNIRIIASLYALRPDADTRVIDALKYFCLDLKSFLTSAQIDALQDNFPTLALELLGSGKFDSDFIELIHHLMSLEESHSLYLPYAGEGAELLGADFNLNFSGFETNPILSALSEIRLNALGCQAEISREKPDLSGACFDRILSVSYLSGGTKEYFQELTTLGIQHLTEGGRLVGLLPQNFLNSVRLSEARKAIASSDMSVTVIALPRVIFRMMESCLLVLDNNHRSQVRLIDASDMIKEVDQMREKFDLEQLKRSLESAECEKTWAAYLSDLRTDDYSLHPSHYLSIPDELILEEGERIYSLGELIELVDGDRIKDDEQYVRRVGRGDLKSDYLSCDIEVTTLPLKLGRRTDRILSEECLLMSFSREGVSVGRLIGASLEHPVSVMGSLGTILFKNAKPELITDSYLLRALCSDFTFQQCQYRSRGNSLFYSLDPRDFRAIKIVVPDKLERQEEYCREDSIKAMKKIGLDLELCSEEFRKDMHLKKHAIGQSIFNLNNCWEALKTARERNNGVLDDKAPLAPSSQRCVADLYNNLDLIIRKLNKQIEKFDAGYGLIKSDFEINDFLRRYVDNNQGLFYQVEFVKAEQQCRITFAQEALTMVLDNIFNNAETHGFVGKENCRNCIRISINYIGTDCIINIANNGLPLTEGFLAQNVFDYGQSTGDDGQHFGIGGYEIRKLMREFGADVELLSTPSEDFTVTYKLIFHNTNLGSDEDDTIY